MYIWKVITLIIKRRQVGLLASWAKGPVLTIGIILETQESSDSTKWRNLV